MQNSRNLNLTPHGENGGAKNALGLLGQRTPPTGDGRLEEPISGEMRKD